MSRVALLLTAVLALAACAGGTGGDPDVAGEWELAGGTAHGGPLAQPAGARATLDLFGDEARGVSFCNHYFSAYRLSGSSFALDDLGGTDMGCEPEVIAAESRSTIGARMAAFIALQVQSKCLGFTRTSRLPDGPRRLGAARSRSHIAQTSWKDGRVSTKALLSDGSRQGALWGLISSHLREQGVPEELLSELRPYVTPGVTGALLYGSWARGDTHPNSDLDVLFLAATNSISPPSDRISVSYYTERQLRAAAGTLFGLHLARDGVVLADEDGELAPLLESMGAPDPEALMRRIQHLSTVLTTTARTGQEHLPGLIKVGRYLLRSALYAKALSAGQPCFSVREIATREGDPRLVSILSSHTALQPEPSMRHFHDIRQRLAAEVGDSPRSKLSLESLAVASWEADRDLSRLATLAISDDDTTLPYSEIDKVVL